MSTSDPVTADLSRSINFGAPGYLVASPNPQATFTPIVETTAQAALHRSRHRDGEPAAAHRDGQLQARRIAR